MASTAAVLNIIVSANTGQAQAALARVDKQLKGTAASGAAAGKGVGRFGTAAKYAAAGGVAALVYGLYKSVTVGMDFEKQMSSLRAVTGASGRQMEAFERQALAMAKGTIFGAREVAQAQTELAKAGLTPAQILGGALKSALDLAAAGEIDLADAAKTTANALNLFSLPASKAGQVADMLATAANTTTAEVSDFAMALTQGGSAAKQVGFSLNDTVVVLEALAKAGIKNSDAGTSMKTALLQLAAPTQRQIQLARELGLEFFNQAGEMKNPIQLAGELRDAMGDMTRAQRTAALKVLAGTDGFRTLASLYDLGAENARKLAGANTEAGTAADVASQKTDNLAGDLERLRGAAENTGISISQRLEPALRKTVQGVTTVVEGFNRHRLEWPGGSKIVHTLEQLQVGAQNWWLLTQKQKDALLEMGHAVGLTKDGWAEFLGDIRESSGAFEEMKAAMTAALQQRPKIPKLKQGIQIDIEGNPAERSRKMFELVANTLRKPLPKLKPIVDPQGGISKASGMWSSIKSILGKPIPKLKPTIDPAAKGQAAALQSAIAAEFSQPITQYVNIVARKINPFASGGSNIDEQVGVVGERGRELMITDRGMAMLGERGPQLTAIPQGADILTAAQTRQLLAAGIPGFAKGKLSKSERRDRRRARETARRESVRLNLEAILAAAELTAGTADDIAAIGTTAPRAGLLGYWTGIAAKNKNAAKMKDPIKRQKGLEKLLEARQQIKSYSDQLADLLGAGTSAATDSGLTDLYKQLATLNAQRYLVSQSQYGVLKNTPYAGSFAGGGVVPGPIGQPQVATVHGGESILPTSGRVEFVITNWRDGTGYLRSMAAGEADKAGRRAGRGVNRTPGNAGVLQ